MRVAALGRTRILSNTIAALKAGGHEVCLIATCRAAPEYDVKEDVFRELARENRCEFLISQTLNSPQVIEKLKEVKASIAVSVNWINIIGPDACGAFPKGILNAHAGDLPRYRGNAPIAWAILQGESSIGLTIHKMDPFELDAGPVYAKDTFPLSEDTYIGEVYSWVEDTTPGLFLRVMGAIENGGLRPTPQPSDPSLSLRCYPRLPEDGLINWDMPADYLARLVRASSEPFAGAYTFLNGVHLTIWRARSERWDTPSLWVPGQVLRCDKTSGEVTIGTGSGVLLLQQVQMGGRNRSEATDVITGIRYRLGH